jgi:hypothetical protein
MTHDPTPQPTAEGTDSSPENESSLTGSSVVSPTAEQSTTESDHDAGDDPETCPVCDVAYDSVSIHDGVSS